MEPFRILHCLRAPVGGLFRHVYDLAAEQSQMGHEVGILCDSTTADGLTESRLAELAPLCALGVHRTAMSRLISHLDPLAVRKTMNLTSTLKCDVLHGHGAKGGVYARIASRSNRRHGVHAHSFYTPHGGTLNYKPGSLASRVFLAIERQLLPITDGLCFESQYASDKFERLVGKPDCAVRVIPNGVRPSEFRPHVLNDDATDFVFLGELRPAKGIDLLIDALAELEEYPEATATLVGDGSILETLQARAQELGIAHRLRWPGAMPAVEAFKCGRAFVMPSRYESFPYVALEAGAQGIPAIMTSVGGVSEITEPGDPFLVEGDNVPALTAALKAYLDAPEILEARTSHLKERVRTHFSTANMAQSVVNVYQQLRTADGRAGKLAA